jgi:preprotein translocase subunit SecD
MARAIFVPGDCDRDHRHGANQRCRRKKARHSSQRRMFGRGVAMPRYFRLCRIAYPLALAVLCAAPAGADVPSGPDAGGSRALARELPSGEPRADKIRTAEATGRWNWLVDRIHAYISNRNAEAELKRSEAAFRRQGGSRMLVKVDADALREAMLIALRDDVRRHLREARIPFGGLAAHNDSVEVRIREAKDWEQALSKLVPLSEATSSGRGGVDIVVDGEGLIRLTPTESGFADRLGELRKQSMEVIARRLDNFGVAASGVQPDGPDCIRVLLPGVNDPERLRAIFNKRARIAFRLVDTSMTAAEALRGSPPPSSEVLYWLNTRDPLLLVKTVALWGDDIVDASPGFDQRTNEPIVTFRFKDPAFRPGHRGECGAGRFTVEDAYTTAMLLRSGTLPGRLVVVEQQVVEPARDE